MLHLTIFTGPLGCSPSKQLMSDKIWCRFVYANNWLNPKPLHRMLPIVPFTSRPIVSKQFCVSTFRIWINSIQFEWTSQNQIQSDMVKVRLGRVKTFSNTTRKLPRRGNNSLVAFDFWDKYSLNTNGNSYTWAALSKFSARLHRWLMIFLPLNLLWKIERTLSFGHESSFFKHWN